MDYSPFHLNHRAPLTRLFVAGVLALALSCTAAACGSSSQHTTAPTRPTTRATLNRKVAQAKQTVALLSQRLQTDIAETGSPAAAITRLKSSMPGLYRVEWQPGDPTEGLAGQWVAMPAAPGGTFSLEVGVATRQHWFVSDTVSLPSGHNTTAEVTVVSSRRSAELHSYCWTPGPRTSLDRAACASSGLPGYPG